MKLYSDSKSAISIVHDLIQHDRMKHVRINKNFIKSEIDNGTFTLHFVPTKLQEANLIKALLKSDLESNVSKIGMIDIYSLAWGGVLEDRKIQIRSRRLFLFFVFLFSISFLSLFPLFYHFLV